jgi:hypothetical protein
LLKEGENTMILRAALIVLLTIALIGPALSVQAGEPYFARYERDPSAAWMGFDVLIGRPVGIATSITGTGLFMGTLPITLITGTAGHASRAFIERPGKWTFKRRLGRRGTERDFFLP